MEANAMGQAPGAGRCACGRLLQAGANFCDACGHPVAFTDVTTRLRRPALFTRLSREEMTLLLAMLREGMEVRASDGKRLGKVIQVHVREPAVYLHVAAERHWWTISFNGTFGLYLPARTIAEVDTTQVLLNIDAPTAQGCTSCPSWILPPVRILPPT